MATSRIFIKGLPPSISENDFRKHFSAKNREVTDVKLIPQRRIGYVGYKSPEDASSAVKYFNRSFIRMSRISVEPARPISDLPPSKGLNAARNGSIAGGANTASISADETPSSKKRKREVLDKSDPRLKEYLQVMKPGHAGVAAEHDHMALPEQDVPAQTLVQEDASDDEYESIPTRREKQPKLSPSVDRPAETRQSKAPKAGGDTTAVVPAAPSSPKAPASKSAEATPEGATDDDWLRSRTNRLLDLIDPDDIIPPSDAAPQTEPTESVVVANDGPAPNPEVPSKADCNDEDTHMAEAPKSEDPVDAIRSSSRLFIRNLRYSVTEEDLRQALEKYGTLEELHVPVTSSGTGKGFALVSFSQPTQAIDAFQSLDRTTFQGRILHLIPAQAKRDHDLDEFAISKLPLKKQNLIRKRAEAASSSFNWNSLFMSQDAVNESMANRLGVTKTELLDPTSADAAVKQAIAETTVIQDTKAYFAANGVDLDAFRSQKRGDTAILVKNFPYGTTLDELRKLFEEAGPVLRVLMPPSGTIAIVQFAQPGHAKAAFGRLAYRRIKDSVLYLEKAPKDLFSKDVPDSDATIGDRQAANQKLNVGELFSEGDKVDAVETTSLFVRNLNFSTTTSRLAEAFESLDGFVSARVKTKMDPKKPGQTLSMGFGFVEFRSKEQAQAALKVMDGRVLEAHTLAVKASHKGHDAAEERRREDKAKKAAGQRTKIIIKNLPFQATKKDVRTLFGTYGQLRSVRVPKKADYTTRGFAFADFITPREAENALNALKNTHLLGRKLVLDFAEAEAVDAEEEIEKMQRKVGGQAHKVALQKLTGGGRQRVNIGNEEDAEG